MRTLIVTVVLAIGLTLFFWAPLWQGGGFVGGDIYSYYLPQKVVYAESLAQGDIPTWNNRVGFGYPLVGESQTGVFYPLNLFLYRFLSVNSAYNFSHLLHYVLAFLGVVAYARSLKISAWGSLFAALVYVYAWFPSRCCWEWAIVSGAWLPITFWLVERYRQTSHWRWLISLSVVLALQLLAGHFNIAFITQVVLALYVVLRFLLLPEAKTTQPANESAQPTFKLRLRSVALISLMMGASFALAAIQLIPTWELKNLSQRATAGSDHNLAHGSIPPAYWSQAIVPWKFYSPEFNRDQYLKTFETQIGAPTNQVEAHLYFGLIPLGLACLGFITAIRERNKLLWIWMGLGILSFVYTSGLLLAITQRLPGFNFFQGPGRFGIITTLAVGLLAGYEFDHIQKKVDAKRLIAWAIIVGGSILGLLMLVDSTWTFAEATGTIPLLMWQSIPISGELCVGLLVLVLPLFLFLIYESFRGGSLDRPIFKLLLASLSILMFVVTAADLWVVGRLVTYSTMVTNAPINSLSKSPLRTAIFNRSDGWQRILAPGANLPTALGVAAFPTYFTFGPAAYSDEDLMLPEEGTLDRDYWLKSASIQYELRTEPTDMGKNERQLVWQGMDPVLNAAWGQYDSPLFLYQLKKPRPRVGFVDQQENDRVELKKFEADSIVVETASARDGRVYLTDLQYPGWQVTIDGQPAKSQVFEKIFRAVDVPAGGHTVTWEYNPTSLQWGKTISCAMLLFLATIAHIRFWHPHWFRKRTDSTN